MGSSWIEALKKWNTTANKSGNWCVPKKGTSDYEAVRKMMGSGSASKPMEKKEKKEKKMLALPKGVRSKPAKKEMMKEVQAEIKKAKKSKKKGDFIDAVSEKEMEEYEKLRGQIRSIAGKTAHSRKDIEAGKKEAERLLAEKKKKKVAPAAPEPAKPTLIQAAEKVNVLVPKSKKVIKS